MSSPIPSETKFLPIREIGEAVHVGTLAAAALKETVREQFLKANARQPHSLPGYQKILNSVAQQLGIGGDFGEYQKKYHSEFLPFLAHHGLREQKCLLAGDNDPVVRLTYRQIADRLFASGSPYPTRIFTGHGIDFWDLLAAAETQNGLSVVSPTFDRTGKVKEPRRAQHFPPQAYEIKNAGAKLQYVDTHNFNNFLGQQLCAHAQPLGNGPLIATLYRMSTEEEQKIADSLGIFRRVIETLDAGWVHVIPYPHNENLILLADGHGAYDFIFRNLRDAPPAAMPLAARFLDGVSIPPDEDRKFETESYFYYDGWREFDQHEAEQAFYANGGTPASYPGESTVLRNYLIRDGRWNAVSGSAQHGTGKDKLCITGLVSIKEILNFLNQNSEYFEHRKKTSKGDPWLEANGCGADDLSLPASVNWIDAVSYAVWATSQGPKKYRLLTEEEYREHFFDLIPDHISADDVRAAARQKLCRFEGPNGNVYDGQPPHMREEDFAKIKLRYIQPLPWKSGRNGTLVRSCWFGEWLAPENAAINGLFFCAQREFAYAHEVVATATRARFASGSTGKYKGMKIGFRLVVED